MARVTICNMNWRRPRYRIIVDGKLLVDDRGRPMEYTSYGLIPVDLRTASEAK